MNTVKIFANAIDPEAYTTGCVDDVCEFIKEYFHGTFPDTAKIFHNLVDDTHNVTPYDEASIEHLQSLTGTFYVVVWPEDPITIAVIAAIALAAVAIGLAFLFRPKPPYQAESSPNNELTDRQNKARPNERIPDIVGTVRSTPDLLAFPYKAFVNNAEFEYNYMCIGRGAYTIIDCKDDQTPVDEIAGEYAAVYPPFSSPNSVTPVIERTFGFAPSVIPKVVTLQQSNAVNGQIVRAPNSGQFRANNDIAFKYGGLILCNNSNVDFTSYFAASTLLVPTYLEIFTNDSGINASDPAQIVHSIGLAGVYQILAVTASQITLSAPALVNANWNILATFGSTQSTFYHTFDMSTSGSVLDGPYILNVTDLTQVWANFVAPNGLCYVDNKGRQKGLTVTIEMDVQAVNAAFSPIGDIISGSIDVVGSSVDRTICGSTLKLVLPSPGPVQVTVKRITPMGTDMRNAWTQDIQWRDLYAVSDTKFVMEPPIPVTAGHGFAWAKPLAVAHGGDSLTSATLTNAHLRMSDRGLPGSWAQWTGFSSPTLPGDAVVSAIIPVFHATALGGFNPAWGAAIGLDASSLTPFLPNSPSMSYGTSLGTLLSDLASLAIGCYLENSVPFTTGEGIMDVSFVGMAVYYSSATPSIDTTVDVTSGDFGNVTTVLAITAQTPDALSIKQRKLNLLVTRNLPTWIDRTSPGAPVFGTVAPTNNAADIFCALALDPYIGRRQLVELDVAGIYAVADSLYMAGEHVNGEIVDYFGTFLMTEFCYTFDDSKVSFEESAAYIAQAINCIAYRSASTISLSFEKKTENSRMLFNHRNKIPDSETRTVSFGMLNDNDSVQLNYIDPSAPNFPDVDTTLTLYYPQNKSGVNPKKVTGIGVRNIIQATMNGWRLFQKLVYSNVQSEFEATQEASLRIINDRVLVADNTRNDTQDGQILAQTGLTVTTSQNLVFVEGQTYTAFLQHYDDSVEAIAVTAGSAPNQMVLSAAPALPLVTDASMFATTTYVLVSDTTTMRPMPFLISTKEPQSNNTFKLSAINYNDTYYAHDTDLSTGLLIAPIAGYGPQGYTGSGLLKADGTTYVPPARGGFDGGAYTGSGLDGSNNPDTPVTDGPPDTSTGTLLILVNGS